MNSFGFVSFTSLGLEFGRRYFLGSRPKPLTPKPRTLCGALPGAQVVPGSSANSPIFTVGCLGAPKAGGEFLRPTRTPEGSLKGFQGLGFRASGLRV